MGVEALGWTHRARRVGAWPACLSGTESSSACLVGGWQHDTFKSSRLHQCSVHWQLASSTAMMRRERRRGLRTDVRWGWGAECSSA